TAFTFSTENWKRDTAEVSYLMDLLVWVVTKELNDMFQKGVRIRWLGSRERLSPKIIKAIESAELKTKVNTQANLNLCFNYGGRQEIAEAAARIVESGVAAGQVDEELISANIYHPDVPDIDLIIRTS